MQMRKLKQKIFYIQPPINAYKNANQFLHRFERYVNSSAVKTIILSGVNHRKIQQPSEKNPLKIFLHTRIFTRLQWTKNTQGEIT